MKYENEAKTNILHTYIYGMFKYFHIYFSGEKRGLIEAKQAMYMEMYHLIVGVPLIAIPLGLLIQKL